MERLYYSFNQFLRDSFGCRVQRLSLDAGFGCPNIGPEESDQGCIFCNNKSFSRFTDSKTVPLKEQIDKSIQFARSRYKAKKFIAYFQGFTSTYADVEVLEETYRVIKEFPDIIGLSISTRPDCIDSSKLDLIQSYTKDYMVWIEYGLQSARNLSLDFLNRNHTFEDFLAAIELTRNRGILMAAHIILGIPGESRADVLATAKKISRVGLSGVKFHCLHAVRGTALESLYNKGGLDLLDSVRYVELISDFLELIPRDWTVLRLVSDCDKKYLVAPLWVNSKQKVITAVEEELITRGSYQGRKCNL